MKYLIVVFALLLPCASVYAQNAEECPKRPAAEKRAKRWAGRWFLKAENAVKNEKYDLAMDRFLCSLYMTSHENTVYNIAQITKLVDEKEVALEKLGEFVEKNPDHEAAGERKKLIGSVERSMGLKEEPEGPDALDDETAPAPKVEKEEEAPSTNLKVPTIVLFSAAGAGLILSVSLQAAAGAAKNDAEAATSYDSYLDYEDKMRKRQIGATVGFVITGLCAGTGLLFLMIGRQQREDEGATKNHPDISLLPAGNGLVLQGSF